MVLPLQDASQLPSGQRTPTDQWGDYNNLSFVVGQLLTRVQTAMPVQIVACTNAGGVSPVGFADVLPLVQQIDNNGIPTPHTTVYNLPYMRLQGGTNAVIIDPHPGDIGIAVFASRDISGVKATKRQSVPGSYRKFSFSDGMYIGGILNGTPNQYIQFSAAGIVIHSPTLVRLEAPDVQIQARTVEINATTSATVTTPTFTINGNTVLNGTLNSGGAGGGTATFSGDVVGLKEITASGTNVHTHLHGDVESGTSNTGRPI
jgi:hypothetical protein